MLLAPVEDEELEELQQREAIVHCGHLAGKRGTTTTRLNPAGKARFGDEVVDVIGEGELIERGTDVNVASVQGSRIVVVPIANSAEARPA
jgi:membrane-bound ClpP family serine protease